MGLKIIKTIFFVFLFFVIFISPVLAQEKREVVLVNPIRGSDFWNHNFSLVKTPESQYEII